MKKGEKMFLKKLVGVGLFCLLVTINANAEKIQVLGAASLKYVLEEIKADFLKNRPQDEIEISYISSGKAYAQIKNGSPISLFVSADVSYPAKLFEEKLAPQKEIIYAKGKLVLWSNNKDFKLAKFEDILNPKIQHIAIPNPKVAPYGRASMEALEKTKILSKVEAKFVTGESIAQATTYVESQNAQVGFSALSMLGEGGINTPTMSYVIIDETLYSPIEQALIIPNYGKDSKLARDFKDYILSAKKTFLKFGYSTQ